MSDLMQIAKSKDGEVAKAAPASTITLPHALELPSRYYGRLALEETVRAFADVATIETKVGDGVLSVTFKQVEAEPDEVVAAFLNHVLYLSATAGEDSAR